MVSLVDPFLTLGMKLYSDR